MLKDEGENGEDAAEEVDGHEGERDAKDRAMLVDLVELWSHIKKKKRGGEVGPEVDNRRS